MGIETRHSSLATRHLLRGSAVVGFFSLLSGVSGILVETSIAAQLGLSRNSDSFYAAFTIPYIITNLLSATSQFSLVPFFSTLDPSDSREGLGRGVSYVVNLVFLGLGLFAAVGALTAHWLMRGIAPGFTRSEIELATQLSRWLFLIIVPAGIAETFRSFLLSRHSFVLSSAAGFIRNIVVIAVILREFGRYGPFSIVLGYIAGYLFQVLVLGAKIVTSFPVRYSLTLTGSGEAFRRLRGAGTAQVGGASAWQVVVLAERMIASFLPAGTLTAVNLWLQDSLHHGGITGRQRGHGRSAAAGASCDEQSPRGRTTNLQRSFGNQPFPYDACGGLLPPAGSQYHPAGF